MTQMKGITCCGDCGYYNWKKHKCTRATDEGNARSNFYADCPLPDVVPVQEPRVMTVSEICALANGDVVWVEFTDGLLLPMMVEDGCLMRWRFLWRICEDAFYGEDYKARAWTSRPTDEQREATPWRS